MKVRRAPGLFDLAGGRTEPRSSVFGFENVPGSLVCTGWTVRLRRFSDAHLLRPLWRHEGARLEMEAVFL